MEQMAGEEKEKEKKTEKVVFRAWDCGSPLYDSFELASVYHVLDSHLMALPFVRGSVVPDMMERAEARRTAPAKEKGRKRRKAAATRRTGKAVLHSICRSVTCSRKF